jgi:hypothetical protein
MIAPLIHRETSEVHLIGTLVPVIAQTVERMFGS